MKPNIASEVVYPCANESIQNKMIKEVQDFGKVSKKTHEIAVRGTCSKLNRLKKCPNVKFCEELSATAVPGSFRHAMKHANFSEEDRQDTLCTMGITIETCRDAGLSAGQTDAFVFDDFKNALISNSHNRKQEVENVQNL